MDISTVRDKWGTAKSVAQAVGRSDATIYNLAAARRIRRRRDDTTGGFVYSMEDAAKHVGLIETPPTETPDTARTDVVEEADDPKHKWLRVTEAAAFAGRHVSTIAAAGSDKRLTRRKTPDGAWEYRLDTLQKMKEDTRGAPGIKKSNAKAVAAAAKSRAKPEARVKAKPSALAKRGFKVEVTSNVKLVTMDELKNALQVIAQWRNQVDDLLASFKSN